METLAAGTGVDQINGPLTLYEELDVGKASYNCPNCMFVSRVDKHTEVFLGVQKRAELGDRTQQPVQRIVNRNGPVGVHQTDCFSERSDVFKHALSGV